jgi:hypothetical protein
MKWEGELAYHFERDDNPAIRERFSHITYRYNIARDLVLNGGYDALLTVESDMVIPELALLRLARVKADVVYSLAVTRRSKRLVVFTEIGERWCRWLQADEAKLRQAWGNVIETQGAGFGCTLIHRHVLEEIEFRRPKGGSANDWYFALDCVEKGFKQMTDMGVICGHITTKPEPMIMWPDIDANDWYSVEPIKDVDDLLPVRMEEADGLPNP